MSNPEPTPIWSPSLSSEKDSLPPEDQDGARGEQDLIEKCREILLFTQWAQKEGHITEQGRYRINESILQENFIKIRLREDSLEKNPFNSQMGSMSTSVLQLLEKGVP